MDYNAYSLKFEFYRKYQICDFCFLNQNNSLSLKNIKNILIKFPVSMYLKF